MIVLDPAGWAGRDVLLLAPHPDDESLGCGGTAHLAARAGARVAVVVCCRGDGGVGGGAMAEDRQAECRRACDLLGLEAPRFLGLGSQALRQAPDDAATALRDSLEPRRFDVLLLPSPLERHATHRAALLAGLLAGVAGPGAAHWGYGVWDTLPADGEVAEVDVTAARSAKTRAIAAHASQDGPRPLAAGMSARDLSQAVFSAISGDEPRKAVERLLPLDELAAVLAGLGPGGPPSPSVARQAVAGWLAERAAAAARALWDR